MTQGEVQIGEENQGVFVEKSMKTEFRIARLLLLLFAGIIETESSALLLLGRSRSKR